jgi:general L-amino acid transport system substrate-binding protein
MFALVEAEELGVTAKNVDEMLKSPNPAVQRLLGVTGGFGKMIGLDDRWAYNAIKAMGNYGEIFERHLGKNSPLQLERGVNALWTKGGLMYAPPVR